MKTFTKDEIHQELLKSLMGGSIIKQRYSQLIKALRKREPAMVAEALIDFMCDCDDRVWAAKKLAGKLLFELNPQTDIPLEEILNRTLPKWDASVEEFPFYLSCQFGEKEIRLALSEVQRDANDPLLRTAAGTMNYWVERKEWILGRNKWKYLS